MKKYFLISLLIVNLLPINLFPQNKDKWTAFEDSITGLYGFINPNGEIKVEPKYLGFMLAQNFSDIIAVMEDNNESYYLLKNGKKLGRDSLYIFDNGFDCESEGYIRFSDKKNNNVGMFNSEGIVVIPAEYNYLTQVRNGLVVGLKGARREYWNNDSTDEHWSLKGGTKYLCDVKNNILVRDFTGDDNLDLHSLMIENEPSLDSLRESFHGVNGKYYTFYNNEKLFKDWLIYDFLTDFNKDNLLKNAYSNIIYWAEDSGWGSKKSSEFIEDNFELVKEKFLDLTNKNSDYFISPEDFITSPGSMYEEFEKYLDNCGNLKTTQYPLMDVVINQKTENDLYQDHFTFFKTEKGFKLLLVTIRNDTLKESIK
jgi:hypothetical protein